MGYIQGADRNQTILLPDTLDDYVDADNEVRAIDAFIGSLDVGAMGFKAEPAKEGRPGYDPCDMLKLYMYGYLNHIRSSRRLQKEAARNVELMWLLKKIAPDFRCIADFRKDNAKAIKEVFKAFVKLCNAAGLLSHESVVIDGSKFRAVNADNKSFNARMRAEFLNGELFDTMYEAQVLTQRWVRYYNQVRPHSSLGGRPPAPQTVVPIAA